MAVNTKGWIGSPRISRDGTVLWFSYSRYSVVSSEGITRAVLSGPDRPRHDKNEGDPERDRKVYVTSLAKGRWVAPAYWDGNGSMECSGAMYVTTNGGHPAAVYLHMNFGSGKEICTTRVVNGVWTPIKRLGIRHMPGSHDTNPFVTEDHARCFFTSDREGGFGGKDLWVSEQSASGWSEPVNLGPDVNTEADEDNYFASHINGEIYFDRSGSILRGVSDPQVVDLGIGSISDPSMPDDGLSLYFLARFPAENRNRIMVTTRADLWAPWGTPKAVD